VDSGLNFLALTENNDLLGRGYNNIYFSNYSLTPIKLNEEGILKNKKIIQTEICYPNNFILTNEG
jgi:hypothetical protein